MAVVVVWFKAAEWEVVEAAFGECAAMRHDRGIGYYDDVDLCRASSPSRPR